MDSRAGCRTAENRRGCRANFDRDGAPARGKEHPLAPAIRRLADKCREAFALPVYFSDEYLSSHEARARLPAAKEVDAMAAVVIAEDWLAAEERGDSMGSSQF